MVVIYKYIANPQIYAIYRVSYKTIIISNNPLAVNGAIYIEY
nr:MAG TPA: hypothetical protein [Caudoviricetes sp.]